MACWELNSSPLIFPVLETSEAVLLTSSAPSAARQAGGWQLGWLPAYSACMCLWLRSACGPHAGQGSEPRGIALCFLPTRFLPRSQQPSVPAACSASLGGCSPGSHKAWRPASDPFLASLPKVPGGQRDYGPHPELAVTHALSWGFGMSTLEGPWECSQPGSLCTDGSQAHESETSFRLSDAVGSSGLDPGTLGPQSSILLHIVTE